MAETSIKYEVAESSQDESGRPQLGSLLTARGFLTEAQLSEALAEGAASGVRLGEVVVGHGWASEDDVAKLLAEQWQLGYVERASIFFDADALGRMSRAEAQRLGALPTRIQDGNVVVAVAEPTEERLSALREVIGDDTVVVVVPKSALDAGLRSELLSGRGDADSYAEPQPQPRPQPAVAPDPPRPAIELAGPIDPPLHRAERRPAAATDLPEPDLDRFLAELADAAREASVLQAGVAELAARLARLEADAAAATARLSEAAGPREGDQAKIERLERQLAERTDVTESLKHQLANLTRTLESC